MNLIRKIFFPFAILYGFVTCIRNYLYDKGILQSYSFDLPVIAVGNLSVGGTGKTPQIEYLIRLLSERYKVATLSRGYKRKSKGFILADKNATAETLGDEPFQFYKKFKEVQVAVDANRKNGIEQLLSQKIKPQIVLLDDAFQHRKVKAGFYILLTSFDDLFYNDFMLPTGNLREVRTGANRADVVIVTKCPKELSDSLKQKIEGNIRKYLKESQPIFFTTIAYDDSFFSEHEELSVTQIQEINKLVVAGIAKPQPFFAYLQAAKKATMTFPDHHDFTEKDINLILEKAAGRKIITTEKDFVRLKGRLPSEQLFYLPIKSLFVSNSDEFDNKILKYVGTSTTNS